jgi:hypothetical protein
MSRRWESIAILRPFCLFFCQILSFLLMPPPPLFASSHIRLIPHNSSSRRLGESKDAMLRDYTEQQRQWKNWILKKKESERIVCVARDSHATDDFECIMKCPYNRAAIYAIFVVIPPLLSHSTQHSFFSPFKTYKNYKYMMMMMLCRCNSIMQTNKNNDLETFCFIDTTEIWMFVMFRDDFQWERHGEEILR